MTSSEKQEAFGKEEQQAQVLRQKGWGCESPATWRLDIRRDASFQRIWSQASSYTMISQERAYTLYTGLRYILDRQIPGDLAECGVWQGGSCLIMALTLMEYGASFRTIWMYDTYEGMTPPGDEDRIEATGEALAKRWKKGWWAAGMEQVRGNLDGCGYPLEAFKMVKGDVCQTLDKERPESLALLRLDTDWYASTKKELEVLYPLLVRGGILIIDDYGHFKGARQAVDEYFHDPLTRPFFQRSDYTGRCALKF